MLEHFYKERRTLVDFRRGPLGPYFDGFAAHLKTRGYAHHHAKAILGRCCLFNTYLMDHGITTCRRVSPSLIEPFLNLYQPDTKRRSHYATWMDTQRAVKHLFAYLVTVHTRCTQTGRYLLQLDPGTLPDTRRGGRADREDHSADPWIARPIP